MEILEIAINSAIVGDQLTDVEVAIVSRQLDESRSQGATEIADSILAMLRPHFTVGDEAIAIRLAFALIARVSPEVS